MVENGNEPPAPLDDLHRRQGSKNYPKRRYGNRDAVMC